MRKILTTLILSGSCLIFAHSANARSSQSYETNITALTSSSLRIEVGLSEDMQARADGLPDGKRTCIQSRRINNGFACNGFYGQRDLDHLTEKLEEWTSEALTKKGLNITDEAATVLKLTLVDARNNRPTQNQLTHDSSLNFQSFGLGGAEVSGELFDARGNSLGAVSYAYYDNFLDRFSKSNGTWFDARQAMRRFSKRVATDIASNRTTGA